MAVIKRTYIRIGFVLVLFFITGTAVSQTTSTTYQKRVLETAEVDILSSYYSQTGDNAAVTGGIGNEKLTDFAPSIVVSIPLNANDVLTVDAGISTYTSASSSNLDPFDTSGASTNDGDVEGGSPWVASSGASRQDTWSSLSMSYAHSSEDRNEIWSVNASVSSEYVLNG